MVGQKEARSLAWLWLHHALGWKHVHFLSMGITENETDKSVLSGEADSISLYLDEKRSDDEECDVNSFYSMMANASSVARSVDKGPWSATYSTYVQCSYSQHLPLIELIALYSGSLFGWKEPWIVQSPSKVLRNLKMYQKTYHYPSQSLSTDDSRIENKRYMVQHNASNILSDSILVSTKHHGYWLGNIEHGQWYELGMEHPHLENLRSAVARGSMSVDLFPRSNRLYFAGGLVMGMPISTIAELDLDSMRLGPVDEMPLPRAYHSMVFFPDSLILIGGTNCWKDVYGVVQEYDFLKQKWTRLKSLKCNRYGACAVTIQEKYIFVAGGCNRFYPVMTSELFDRKTGRWTSYPAMPKPALKCNGLRFKNDIFVTGARDDTVQVFDVYKKRWRLAGKLNQGSAASKGTKLCTFDYKLVAMDRSDISRYEIYDEQSNRWYLTDIRNHPVRQLYPQTFEHSDDIFDWFHLGRRYW